MIEMHIEDSKADIALFDKTRTAAFDVGQAEKMMTQLRSATEVKDVDVRINSRGGSPSEGIAMHALLKEMQARGVKVRTINEGIVASSATLPFSAGDERLVHRGALTMIHNPRVGPDLVAAEGGEAKDLRRLARRLDKMKQSVVTIYRDVSGKAEDEVVALMDEETWMTSDEAVQNGFATSVIDSQAMAASVDMADFENVPEAAMSLVEPVADMTGPTAGGDPRMKTQTDVTATTHRDPEVQTEPPAELTITMTVAEYEAMKAAPEPAGDDGVLAERKRVQDIHSICQMANIDAERELEFIENGANPADVSMAALQTITTTNTPVPDGDQPEADPDAEYRKEYQDTLASGVTMTATEDEYVRTRRIDDGLESLV